MNFTFEDLTTAVGAGAAAVLALTLTQVLKAALPAVFDRVTGGAISFVVLAVIYAIAAAVLSPLDANGYLALFIAWVTSAVAALGLHSVANNGAATFVQGARQDNPPTQK